MKSFINALGKEKWRFQATENLKFILVYWSMAVFQEASPKVKNEK